MKSRKEIINFPDKHIPFFVERHLDILPSRIGLKYHPEVELQYIFSGKCAYLVRNRLYYLNKNDLLIIHPNEPHRYVQICTSQVDKMHIIFSPTICNHVSPYLQEFVDFVYNCSKKTTHLISFPSEVEAEVEFVLGTLLNDWQNKSHYYKETVVHKSLNLFILIKKFSLYQDKKNKLKNINIHQQIYLKNCLNYIDNHYSESIELSHLTEVAHLSSYYLSSLFKKLTGLSFKTHLLNKRISEARSLLEKDPDKKIISIALSVGFNDLSNFNRSFKKLTGINPASYRKFYIQNRK